MRDLGLRAVRVTLLWQAGESTVSDWNAQVLDRVTAGSYGLRVVVALYGRPDEAPVDAAGRDAYCASLADLLQRYPSIDDLVIWNEPNVSRFWRPQFDASGSSVAPAAYEALLARCWDVLHAVRPAVDVIAASSPRGNDNPRAASNVSQSPVEWWRQLALAYRRSRRTRPIFDTVGHNSYQSSSAERPWTVHASGTSVGEGDYARLMQVLSDGFSGTAQPVPGQGGVTIWYMEQGFQTVVPAAERAAYTGQETDRLALQAAGGALDQATQISDAVRLAYCQPAVGAIFNFELADEPDLAGWQSGVLYSDGTPKPSYAALKAATGDVAAGRVDCSRYPLAARSYSATEAVRFSAPSRPRRP
jgi:hypothetical protein